MPTQIRPLPLSEPAGERVPRSKNVPEGRPDRVRRRRHLRFPASASSIGGYEIVDETYTFAQDSFSRKRVHVLTSINYKKMSAEDKAKEPAVTRRTDGDYALSYIQRVGNGRVFYEAHGHDEKVYFSRPFVAHMLAAIQYALGDLKADDSPSEK